MKRTILLLTIALAAISVTNAQTMNVSINKLYTDSSGFVLPDKAIKLKMPLLAIANPKYDFTVKLHGIAQRLADDDYENNVFTVMLQYAGVGISIAIDSHDILDMDKDKVKFHGDLVVDRHHFILLENEDNKELLKTFFKKTRGRDVVFERTFEKVQEMINTEPSHYNAMYNERARSIQENEYIVNSTDKLHASKSVKEEPNQEINIDDEDAFKIDVELFTE